MISVLSSYRFEHTPPKELLPELDRVCQELHDRGFLGIDVVLTPTDFLTACGKGPSPNVKDGARAIEERIRRCTGGSGVHEGSVPLQVCALATNLSAISSVDANEDLWKRSVAYLAAALIVAHRLGTRVVEVVCGSRAHTQTDPNGTRYFTSLTDDDVLGSIQKRFVEGVCSAYDQAKGELGIGEYPSVGVALEIEPDLTSLVRNLADVECMLKEMDRKLGVRPGGEEHLTPDHFGINLDWGHLLLAADRGLLRETPFDSDRAAAEWCVREIKRLSLKSRIMHGHISDHFPGAHRADAAIGTFRPLEAYLPFMRLHSDLMREANETAGGGQASRFFSFAVAIELEARQDAAFAVKCRERLHELRDKAQPSLKIDLETHKDRLRRVEQQIACAGQAEGWLQGINRTIYDALNDLVRCTKEPAEDQALLDEKILGLIREFLSAQEQDERAKRAIKVAKEVLGRLGADILTFWLSDLLDEEWGRSFYTEHRDHALHSVYVYLLGMFLYAESAAIRRKVNAYDDISSEGPVRPALISASGKPSFFCTWALAALTHDIGYPFEAGGETLEQARWKLRQTVWQFLPHLCILKEEEDKSGKAKDVGNVNRSKVSDLAEVNCALLEKIGELQKVFGAFDPLSEVFYLPSEHKEHLRERRVAAQDVFSVKMRAEKAFLEKSPAKSLREVFECFRSQKKTKASRGPYLDHGFLSAAVLEVLVRFCRELRAVEDWSTRKRSFLNIGKKEGKKDQAARMHKSLTDWQNDFRAQEDKDVDKALDEVYFAVMVHNILPSSKPVLNLPDYGKLPFLTFLLGACDVLQEWHRFGFVNPQKQTNHRTLTPLEVEAVRAEDAGKLHLNFKTEVDVRGRRFSKHLKGELKKRFGNYWENFLIIGP